MPRSKASVGLTRDAQVHPQPPPSRFRILKFGAWGFLSLTDSQASPAGIQLQVLQKQQPRWIIGVMGQDRRLSCLADQRVDSRLIPGPPSPLPKLVTSFPLKARLPQGYIGAGLLERSSQGKAQVRSQRKPICEVQSGGTWRTGGETPPGHAGLCLCAPLVSSDGQGPAIPKPVCWGGPPPPYPQGVPSPCVPADLQLPGAFPPLLRAFPRTVGSCLPRHTGDLHCGHSTLWWAAHS